MERIEKNCPVCQTLNPIDAVVCINCMSDLSTAVVEEKKEETLKISALGQVFEIKNNQTLGRQATLSEVLSPYKTVSRFHAKFIKEDNKWFIEDVGSTNGTYLNEEKIEVFKKYEIKPGDKIKLSSAFEMEVVEI